MKCGCHPNCGISTAIMIHKKSKTWAPLPAIIDVETLMADMPKITDAARGTTLTKLQVGLSVLRNYKPWNAPANFSLQQLLKKFDKQSGGNLGGGLGAKDNANRRQDEWMILFMAGMWFQDLFNYDFRRTEMCIIPYGTQLGEISFCAYNTGIGWRNIIENKMMNMTTAEWFKKKGRHRIYANPQKGVPMPKQTEGVELKVRLPGYETSEEQGLNRGHRQQVIEMFQDEDSNKGDGNGGTMRVAGSAMPNRESLQESVQGSGAGCGTGGCS